MNGDHIRELLRQSAFYVTSNLAELEPADGLVEIPNGGNSLNWILGHIVYWRNEMLDQVRGEPVWRDGIGRQYRGSPGERRPTDFDMARALPLADLVAAFTACDARLRSGLATGPLPDDAERAVLALLGHEIYHAGQLGALRRLAGRAGTL